MRIIRHLCKDCGGRRGRNPCVGTRVYACVGCLVFSFFAFVLFVHSAYTSWINDETKPQKSAMMMHNVCIDYSSVFQLPWHRLTFTAYDRDLRQKYGPYTDIKATIFGVGLYGHWRVYFNDVQNTKSNMKFEDGVLIIPTQWKMSYVQPPYSVFHDILPRLFDLVERAKKKCLADDVTWSTAKLYLAAPTVSYKPAISGLQTIYQAAGFEPIDILFSDTRCFKHALIGHGSRNGAVSAQGAVDKVLQGFDNLNKQDCVENQVLLIQRVKSRRIVNIEELVTVLKELNFKNVEVAELERIPKIEDQIRLVSCAKLIIGVQGAAFGWYPIFRRNAMVVEVIYDHWGIYYTPKFQATRPDMKSLVMNCTVQIPENLWSDLAWYYWIPHIRVTDNLKKKVEEIGLTKKHDGVHIWKFSNVYCEKQHFKQELQKFLSQN